MASDAIQTAVWSGAIPLAISLDPISCRSYDKSTPYFVSCPRLSYLPFLLVRLRAFFQPALVDPSVPAHTAWFSFDHVPLKWQYPIGLLYDLLVAPSCAQPQLPWKLVLHYHDWPTDQLIPLDPAGKTHNDLFINAVKEADYLRNGTAKAIMSLSRADSTALWNGVLHHDFKAFNGIRRRLLSSSSGEALRHVPVKFYLPKPAPVSDDPSALNQAAWRVVQGPVPPTISPGDYHTLGSALHALMPTLFPSRRSIIHAEAILHGAAVPLAAPLQPLLQDAAYCDGFLHVVVRLVHAVG